MGPLSWQWHKMLTSWHSMQKSARWAKEVLAEQEIKHMLTSHGSALHVRVGRNCTQINNFARCVQAAGIVPVVEPEILIDGSHDIQRFQEVRRPRSA